MVDFTNLNDIYHLSMIIIGFCSLIVATAMCARVFIKDRQARAKAEARERASKNKNKNYRRK